MSNYKSTEFDDNDLKNKFIPNNISNDYDIDQDIDIKKFIDNDGDIDIGKFINTNRETDIKKSNDIIKYEIERYVITIIDEDEIKNIDLKSFNKNTVTFGRGIDNDIKLNSLLVSNNHGWFEINSDGIKIVDNNSTNGIYVNNNKENECYLNDGDSVKIDNPVEPLKRGIMFILTIGNKVNDWKQFDLTVKDKVAKVCYTISLSGGSGNRVSGCFEDSALNFVITNSKPTLKITTGDEFIFENGKTYVITTQYYRPSDMKNPIQDTNGKNSFTTMLNL